MLGSHKRVDTGDMLKECLLNNGCYGNVKKKDALSVIVATLAKRIKYFIKNINFLHLNTSNKIVLTGQVQCKKKSCNFIKGTFSVKGPKVG